MPNRANRQLAVHGRSAASIHGDRYGVGLSLSYHGRSRLIGLAAVAEQSGAGILGLEKARKEVAERDTCNDAEGDADGEVTLKKRHAAPGMRREPDLQARSPHVCQCVPSISPQSRIASTSARPAFVLEQPPPKVLWHAADPIAHTGPVDDEASARCVRRFLEVLATAAQLNIVPC